MALQRAANGYFRLKADGLRMTIVGRDARPLLHPEPAKEVIIGPIERFDVIVTAPSAGHFQLAQERTATGPIGDQFPAQAMAEVMVAPDPTLPPPRLWNCWL